jgi:hypothetical protein
MEVPPWEDEAHVYWVANMHGENITAALKQWPELAEGVEVELLPPGSTHKHQAVRIIDERIPPEWRRHSCAVCGFAKEPEKPAAQGEPE